MILAPRSLEASFWEGATLVPPGPPSRVRCAMGDSSSCSMGKGAKIWFTHKRPPKYMEWPAGALLYLWTTFLPFFSGLIACTNRVSGLFLIDAWMVGSRFRDNNDNDSDNGRLRSLKLTAGSVKGSWPRRAQHFPPFLLGDYLHPQEFNLLWGSALFDPLPSDTRIDM